jgi:hypothetical protein
MAPTALQEFVAKSQIYYEYVDYHILIDWQRDAYLPAFFIAMLAC